MVGAEEEEPKKERNKSMVEERGKKTKKSEYARVCVNIEIEEKPE